MRPELLIALLAGQMAAETAGKPLKVVLLADQTASVTWTRTPQVTPAGLQALAALVTQGNGELAFGLIRDRSNRGFLRLRSEAAAAQPDPPVKTGRLFEDQRQMSKYRVKLAQYKEDSARRAADVQRRTTTFLDSAKPLLAQPPDARCTSLWEAVVRADQFLAEDEPAWNDYRRLAIYVSDGIHTCGTRPSKPLRTKGEVLVVNGGGHTGILDRLSPRPFESFDALVRYLQATNTGK